MVWLSDPDLRPMRQAPRLMRPMLAFALATLTPLACLSLGFSGYGAGLVLALVYMTVFVAVADQVLPLLGDSAASEAEFPAANALLAMIGFGALMIVPFGVHALVRSSSLGWGMRGCGALALGLWLGQVAVPCAHELIHRGAYRFVRLGVAIYVMLLFGHHASAHRLVHHRLVATPADPNTAQTDESYYRFFRRAWIGSFRAGWAAETDLRRRQGGAVQGWSGRLTPYTVYITGSVAVVVFAFAIAGFWGIAVWIGLAVHAQAQLLLSDYVQHYGLERGPLPDGRMAPQSPAHSWNASEWLSGRMMLNAARHSDHHLHPTRPFPALRVPEQSPILPWSLPVACTIALIPPLWRAKMAPHLARAQRLAKA
jgi:alkane 1-monooxygenase